jgi:5-methylcytosine-specific restriction endonuclease McrA
MSEWNGTISALSIPDRQSWRVVHIRLKRSDLDHLRGIVPRLGCTLSVAMALAIECECLAADGRDRHETLNQLIERRLDEWKRSTVKRHQDRADCGSKRRRARYLAAFEEPVDRSLVFQNSGGVCSICGKHLARIDFSVDHIVPLALGGKHCMANVQAAHRRCNSKKGARWIGGRKPGRSEARLQGSPRLPEGRHGRRPRPKVDTRLMPLRARRRAPTSRASTATRRRLPGAARRRAWHPVDRARGRPLDRPRHATCR